MLSGEREARKQPFWSLATGERFVILPDMWRGCNFCRHLTACFYLLLRSWSSFCLLVLLLLPVVLPLSPGFPLLASLLLYNAPSGHPSLCIASVHYFLFHGFSFQIVLSAVFVFRCIFFSFFSCPSTLTVSQKRINPTGENFFPSTPTLPRLTQESTP